MKEVKELISEEEINKRILEIASYIDEEYRDREILIVSILKGSIFFMVDLAKRINRPVKLDFMRVSSYNGGTESGEIQMKLDLEANIAGKDVLVIEDIVDTGKTLSYLLEYLKVKKPNSIKLCALLDKPDRREVDVKVDYVGFEIPDKFVVGYGLDFDEKYRNLPYIGYIGE